MANTTTESLEQWIENVQIVKFENLYTWLREIEITPWLQNHLIINPWSVGSQIPLFKSLDFYTGDDYDPLYGKSWAKSKEFELLFPDIYKKSLRNHSSNGYFQHDGLNWILFNIKQCFEDDNNYIFISDLWSIFTAQKQDFNEKWFWAKSLCLLSAPINPANESLTSISNDNWKIKYHLNWIPVWTLQWSCFTYVKVSQDLDIAYIWNGSYIYETKLKKQTDNISKKNTILHEDSDGIDLNLWEIKKLALDPKQNLLFVISENAEWKSNLHVLDHKKLFKSWVPVIDEIKTIDLVTDIIFLDDWNFLLSKSDWTTDLINTNLNSLNTSWWSFEMKKIKVNKWQNQTKKDVLDSLWNLSVSIDTNDVSNEWDEEDMKIIERVRNRPIEYDWISKTLKEWLNDASTEKDIETVKKAFLQIIKQNEKLNSVSDLLKRIEKQINNKKNKIFLDSIFSELEEIWKELETTPNLETLFILKENLESIRKKRRSIQAWSNIKWIKEKDKELKLLLETVAEQIKEYQETHKDELEEKIEKNLEIIKSALDDIENAIDVSSIYTSSIYKVTENMISHLDKDWQAKFKKRLTDLKETRLKEIKEVSNRTKKEKEELIERQKKDVEDNIKQIKDIIEEVDDISTIEQLKDDDPLVQKTKDLISELPSTHAQSLDLKLDKIFGERIFALRLKWEETKWVVQNLDTYWIDTIL